MPKKKNKKKSIKAIPHMPKRSKRIAYSRGRNVVRIFEPSNGGIGRRLKTARRMFRNTTNPRSGNTCGVRNAPPNLIIKENIIATTMFDKGPAKATFSGPYL